MSDTPVIFRKFSDGQVIALFPADPATYSGPDICSYMHVGQHCGASPSVVHCTKLASPDEYASLKAELESAPYSYRLKVCKRITPQHRRACSEEQNRLARRT